jgi:diacylglycerol kinase
MTPQPIVNAFKHALNGTGYFIRHDRNGRIHFVAAILVSAAGSYFRIATTEWCILLLCIAIVVSFEMVNHALENLCNVVHEAPHPLIKTVKDVAAAAVLWSAIISAIIGLIIFIPKISAVL